ncbi:flavin reductase family protein [Truepera radiovictrix]|uniref:Flavin reductase domain protein FMN-binding protein n=1 Tax=Truepera radiovictrix (strain DSM 17093 / CIP 108686 / LMG 22925 / RQ-24) TaxID=649638 RepID=D7CWP3_TRURR|nr:flavin reductase family protein [Truepera radiovictrix]ADI14442.1 flavin reductase domain protein FMN-binding protein [Truepera radiovictrix DSM 17093]WMT57001.1 flavin reductase family protein [Truepera radiovictrix]
MSAPLGPDAPSPLVCTAPPTRFFGYYPGTVAVVTAAADGDRNVMSAGWHAALSAEPPLYGVAVAPERYTYGLLRASGAFAVHFLPFGRADAVAGAGSLSRHEGVDKFAALGLAWRPGTKTPAPILQDAYLAYECRLQNALPTGDHTWFVGEVVALHYRPEAFGERLMQASERVAPAVYYGRATYEALGAGERAVFPPDAFRERA